MTLKGKRVVITRPKQQTDRLSEMIIQLGGIPHNIPTVEIDSVPINDKVMKPIQRIAAGQADIIVFMSQNAFLSFISISEKIGLKKEIKNAISKMQVFSIGSKTRSLIISKGINVEGTPKDYSSQGLADALLKHDQHDKIIVIPRTTNPTDYLIKQIKEDYSEIIQFPVYETKLPKDTTDVLQLIYDITKSRVDIITFTSSVAVQNLFKIAKKNRITEKLKKSLNDRVVVVSIGSVTKKTLENFGIDVQVTPNKYTLEEMVKSLNRFIENDNE